MRRADGLFDITRRDLCVSACAGLALAACVDGSSNVVHTGSLNGGDDDGADANHPPADAHEGTGDATMSSGACTGTSTDVGAATSFVLNTPVYVPGGKFWVVRDSGGLYAFTALCTHEGATTVVQSGHFYCPRHGATFTYNGAILGGPVNRTLVHYAMCTLPNGHVGVMTTMQVAASTRLAACC